MNVKSWKKSSGQDESGNKFIEFTFTTDLDFDPDILVGYLREFPRHINSVVSTTKEDIIERYWSNYKDSNAIYDKLNDLYHNSDFYGGTLFGLPINDFIEYGKIKLHKEHGILWGN